MYGNVSRVLQTRKTTNFCTAFHIIHYNRDLNTNGASPAPHHSAKKIHNIFFRREIDLLKPLLGAERAVDTLVRYHKPSEAPDRSRGSGFDGIRSGLPRDYFFPGLMEFGTQIQNPAHVASFTNLGAYTALRVCEA